jgi:peptidyl-prolyl cis-trans isomerase B (cyclophilin B)
MLLRPAPPAPAPAAARAPSPTQHLRPAPPAPAPAAALAPPPTQHHRPNPLASFLTSAALAATLTAATPASPALASSQRVFLDIAIDASPAGRVVIRTYDDVPIGSARFADLARDRGGVGYVRSRIDSVSPGAFVASSGVASLSYADVSEGGGSVQIAGGETVEDLVRELREHRHAPGGRGVVSLTVAPDPAAAARPPKTKLVAMNGKLVNVEDPRGSARAPNGTGFVISLKQDGGGSGGPLEATNLPVGEVEPGSEALLESLSRLPAAQPTSGSPYFKLAKTLGDRRADVAERFYLRPFQRVVITASGVLE